MNLPDRKKLSFDDHPEGSLDDHFFRGIYDDIRNSMAGDIFLFFFQSDPAFFPSSDFHPAGKIGVNFTYVRTIQFKFKYRTIFFFFFFIPYSAPSQIIDSCTKKKKNDVFRFSPQRIFRVETKLRFRILRSFANAPTPIDFYVALRKATLASELSSYSLREENPFPIFGEIEILIAFPHRLWICAAITESRE